MRLIDADALFEKMEEADWYDNADRDEVAEKLILNAPTIEPEQHWIPCSERLPKPNENVLVTLIDHRRRKIDANWNGEERYSTRIDKIVDYEGDMSHPFWAKGNTPSVLAWMSLPPCYQGEKHEQSK